MFKNKAYLVVVVYSFKGYKHVYKHIEFAKNKLVAKYKVRKLFNKNNIKIININASKSNNDASLLKGNAER